MSTPNRRSWLAVSACCLMLLLSVAACGGTAQPAAATPAAAAPTAAAPPAKAVEPAKPAASPVTIKVSDHFPPTHVVPTNFTKPWIARVEELSKGAVKIQYFPSEQLVKQVDALGALQKKLVDIALVNPALFPTEFPLNGVMYLPSAYDTVAHGGRATKQFLTMQPVAAEYQKGGIRPLALMPFEGMDIMSTKAVANPDDAKGLKIRTAGEGAIAAVKAIGATSVSMGMPEVYTSIQRNALDGVLLPFSVAESYKMGEVTKFSTFGANTSYSIIIYSVNESVWNGLEPAVQKVLQQATDEILPKTWAAMDASVGSAKKYLDKEGVKVTELTGTSKTTWEQKMKPAKQQWAQNMEAKGLPGNQVLAAWDKAVVDTRQ